MRRVTLSKLVRVLFLMIALVGTNMALAADPAPASKPAPSMQIGVLDWQKLIATAPQAKDAGKRLEKEFQKPTEELVNKQKEFQNKRDKLQRDLNILSKAERNKKEKELVRMEQDLRRMDEELRSETTTRHREEMDEFVKSVRVVVEKFSKEQKYDLVLPQEVMVYFSEKTDITDTILQRLEKDGPAEKAKS